MDWVAESRFHLKSPCGSSGVRAVFQQEKRGHFEQVYRRAYTRRLDVRSLRRVGGVVPGHPKAYYALVDSGEVTYSARSATSGDWRFLTGDHLVVRRRGRCAEATPHET